MAKHNKSFYVRKRDGRLQHWQRTKLIKTLKSAFIDVYRKNGYLEQYLAKEMEKRLKSRFKKIIPSTEDVMKVAEEVLIDQGHIDVANAYLLRQQDPRKLKRLKAYFGIPDELHFGMNAMWLLQQRYLLRDKTGEIKETPTQLFERVAKAIALSEKKYKGTQQEVDHWQGWYFQMMSNRAFFPNTPVLMNAGTSHAQLAACFVLPLEDSVSGIFETLKLSAKIQQSGGGTGFDFSSVRPKGDLVSFAGGTASGPLSFLSLFDAATEVMKQGGKRSGANMAVLRYDHPDVESFIQVKSHSGILEHFNLSVSVTDSFMEAVKKKKQIHLSNPHTHKQVGSKRADLLFEKMVK